MIGDKNQDLCLERKTTKEIATDYACTLAGNTRSFRNKVWLSEDCVKKAIDKVYSEESTWGMGDLISKEQLLKKLFGVDE